MADFLKSVYKLKFDLIFLKNKIILCLPEIKIIAVDSFDLSFIYPRGAIIGYNNGIVAFRGPTSPGMVYQKRL